MMGKEGEHPLPLQPALLLSVAWKTAHGPRPAHFPTFLLILNIFLLLCPHVTVVNCFLWVLLP